MTISIPIYDPAINAIIGLIALTGWFNMVKARAKSIIEDREIEQWITVAKEQRGLLSWLNGFSNAIG
jgi:hypothetical protein